MRFSSAFVFVLGAIILHVNGGLAVPARQGNGEASEAQAGPCNPGCIWECVDPERPDLCHCVC
ncbi:hypothetical protein BCR43DRAFT_499388 [Syncephalastrum racemosum]|uniref:Secreted protein n=1 Tax=Syncephalastrum racemosum TaxID=13706 RepID=A0A1X2H089_SYNRA|nr:hypothetical protein BCR43DRAFT_499388 [Syncephalastrum racemosum]